MSTGVAIGLAVGALVLVLYLNKKSEAATAMKVSQIQSDKSKGLFGFGDVLAVGGTVAATYLGGPAAGTAVFRASGERL